MSNAGEVAVEVVGLSKRYGPVTAVHEVSLRIGAGEYFVLLGPSGGGKTTLLRLIGGFLRPSAGRVLLHGEDVSELPPNERPTAMVFQSYALFPHMNVERNVGYGLRLRGLPGARIRRKVDDMLALVGMAGLNARMPHELSGGQQQRVQLARALVLDSDILLLDEPLAALDAKLRKDMCLELKHIQQQVGITFLHVTHNQEEAMTVADHIAIIANGELVEAATPREIYTNPRARYTAGFIGEKNILDGHVVSCDGETAGVDVGHATLRVPKGGREVAIGDAVSLSVASESLRLVEHVADGMEVPRRDLRRAPVLGLTHNDVVRLSDGTDLLVRSLASGLGAEPEHGTPVTVAWHRGDARLHTH